MSDTLTAFTAGDLVVSVYGDGANDSTYSDNQASPIVLEEVTTSGAEVGTFELPQTTTVVNGVTEYAISGEYGSSSEGELQLAANGQSLVIGGYDVNANQYNANTAQYGATALAQTYTVEPSGASDTLVPRVIADISADGTVDTSTALLGVYNTNNIRSVATVDGSSFYISGQGVSGDTTQGVFYVRDGANAATSIDRSTDTRSIQIVNGELYISRDSKQPKGTGTSNIGNYGTVLPTGPTTAQVLPGISQTVTLTAGEENGINNGTVGTAVHLSPEEYFFANPTTLYVADGGNPKEGGLGDGGLQKWSFAGGTWTLDYTLSAGLNLVANNAPAGTTGLIGLTGRVDPDGEVELYATNSTVGDLDQTYLYGITDQLSATTLPTNESFQVLVTAAADTNIRGVSFAPSASCFVAGTRMLTAHGEIAVEDLREGDVMVLADGRRAPVRWIGHRRVRPALQQDPTKADPVRVRAGAFGANLPRRDVLLSPDHAVFTDGVLVPVHLLVDGETIVHEAWSQVAYYNVELDRHDVLLADGLPVESYLDTGNRAQYANCPLSYDPSLPGGEACAELVVAGARLEQVRRSRLLVA